VPFALAEMGDLAQTAVPQLKQMRHDPETAFAAYWALGFVDRDIRTAQLQKLFIGMQSTDAKTRNDARFALGLMQPKELKLQLIQLLKHKNLDISQSAESILATLNAKNGTYIVTSQKLLCQFNCVENLRSPQEQSVKQPLI
jgi:HEAT repeat protein